MEEGRERGVVGDGFEGLWTKDGPRESQGRQQLGRQSAEGREEGRVRGRWQQRV